MIGNGVKLMETIANKYKFSEVWVEITILFWVMFQYGFETDLYLLDYRTDS